MSNKRSDWLAAGKDKRLAMAKNWNVNVAGNADEWGVPEDIRVKLSHAIEIAEREIAIPMSERNTVSNARLKMAFDELTSTMRDIKKRYFFVPPLNEADLAALGLKPKDTNPTNVPAPSVPPEAELFFPAPSMVEVGNIRPLTNSAADKSEYGVRIYYGVMGTSDETDRFRMTQKPKTGNDLPHSVFTRRKNHKFTFTGENGKEVFFCLRYENSKGEAGPWGNIVSAFVP